jgi:general stress protein 26
MATKEELKTVQKRVEKILEVHKIARNDDRFLIAAYLKKYHDIETFKEYFFKNEGCPTVETIRRTRQKIQEKGLYPSDKQIQELRKEQEDVYKEYARG